MQIQALVKAHFNIVTLLEQINAKQHQYIVRMVEILDSKESSSQTLDNVSFIYIKHHINLDFVTNAKDRGNNIAKTSLPYKDSFILAAKIEIDT